MNHVAVTASCHDLHRFELSDMIGRVWAEGAPEKGASCYFTLRGLQSNSIQEKTA